MCDERDNNKHQTKMLSTGAISETIAKVLVSSEDR